MTPAAFGEAEAELVSVLDSLTAVVPGGVAVIATPEVVLFERAFGLRARLPGREAATLDTLWDCASLTKPLVTASCLLALRRQGLDFEAPVTELVPELAGGPGHRAPTLAELLLHSGGLPAWEPLYAVAPGGLSARAAWLGRHREAPGRTSVYGCPGYQVLGLAVERAAGEPLAKFPAELLWPQRDDAWLLPPPRLAYRCAPTEVGNVFERELAGARARGYGGFRNELIRGDVHDHNAFTIEGAAGNAGLFATGAGIAALATRFLVPDAPFSERDLAELSRDMSPGDGDERRTWGFQLATSASSPAGPALGPRCFGHTGFTGTSVMVDPDRGAAYVLLTNRVHPRWTERAFNEDRRRFHVAAAKLADAAGRGRRRG